MTQILAKTPADSASPRPEETLIGHCLAVAQTFEVLFGLATQPTRMAWAMFRFFRLPENLRLAFYATGRAACLLHDAGKSNSWFQMMLAGQSKVDQVIRHEGLSGLLLVLPEVRDFLRALPHVEADLLMAAIAGHHLRREDMRTIFDNQSDARTFFLVDQTVTELFAALSPMGAALSIPTRWDFNGSEEANPSELSGNILRRLNRLDRSLKKEPNKGGLLRLLRLALILADAVSSGLTRTGRDIPEFVAACFAGQPLCDADIQSEIIAPRLAQIEARTGQPFVWHGFQNAAATLPERALLLSSCGSGKTLAAWRWIAARLRERPAMRAIFLYPTRASATEGFRDYVALAPEDEGALLHGTAAYELEGLFDQPLEPGDPRRGKEFGLDPRLYALGAWSRRIFAATVDQFLGFMRHGYGAMCLTPLLVDSVLVVDEVHSFDPSLFSMLETFLKHFEVPVLCMTASLPPNRRERLIAAGLTQFPRRLEDFPDLLTSAKAPRYRVRVVTSEEARQASDAALIEGARVLWIANTVDRCQAEARGRPGALCYHSRFRLKDRQQRHQETIAAFQRTGSSVFAATTQVCEMSLDLDADLLISELAPIPSLIQRMGRCNRRLLRAELGEVLVILPEGWARGDLLPYESIDMEAARAFVADLDGQEVSQARLEELLEVHCPAKMEGERYAAFLEDGAFASCGEPLRETGEYTVSAILTDDVGEYFHLKRGGLSVDGLMVPAPRWLSPDRLVQRDRLWRVDGALYDAGLGLLKAPKEEIW